jgi:hypothetical protein
MGTIFRMLLRLFSGSLSGEAAQRPSEPPGTGSVSDAAQQPSGRHHIIVLASVVTFMVGLFVIQLVTLWLRSPYAFQRLSWSDPLAVLHLTVGSATLIYFALRNDEGDFRALLCVAIVLFLGEEAMAYLARMYGALPFRAPAMMTAFASAFFGAVAVVAASFDHDELSRETCHKLATAGAFAILIVSSLRFLGGLFRRVEILDFCGTLVLGVALFGLSIGLAYTYIAQRRRAARPVEHPHE